MARVLVKYLMISGNAVIHLFYCSNSMTESEAQSLQDWFGGDGLRMLSLPCSGKMTIPYLLKAFEMGAEGIVICSCPPAECKHLEGHLRASKRAEAVDGLMDEIGLGTGRVLIITKGQGNVKTVIDGIEHFRKGLSVVPASSGAKPIRAVATSIKPGAGAGDRRENAA